MELALVERPTDFSVGKIALRIYKVFRQIRRDDSSKQKEKEYRWNDRSNPNPKEYLQQCIAIKYYFIELLCCVANTLQPLYFAIIVTRLFYSLESLLRSNTLYIDPSEKKVD